MPPVRSPSEPVLPREWAPALSADVRALVQSPKGASPGLLPLDQAIARWLGDVP